VLEELVGDALNEKIQHDGFNNLLGKVQNRQNAFWLQGGRQIQAERCSTHATRRRRAWCPHRKAYACSLWPLIRGHAIGVAKMGTRPSAMSAFGLVKTEKNEVVLTLR
jgi:hypothetical protein